MTVAIPPKSAKNAANKFKFKYYIELSKHTGAKDLMKGNFS